MKARRRSRRAWPLAAVLVGICTVLALLLSRDHVGAPTSENGESQPRGASVDVASSKADEERIAQDSGNLRVDAYCTVRCVDAELAPVGGCEVIGWRDGAEGYVRQTAGDDGIATFQAAAGSGGFAVIGSNGLYGLLWPIEWKGEHSLMLGGADRVDGTVLVDGAPAPDGLEVVLQVSHAEVADRIPPVVVAQLSERAGRLVARTSHGGSFAFSGLPRGCRGTLFPPVTHWLIPPRVNDGWSAQLVPVNHALTGRVVGLEVRSPVTRLVISMTRLPVISGRVVWDEDGSPVVSATVIVHGEFARSVKASNRCLTAADGSFSVGLEPSVTGTQEEWLNPDRRPQMERVRVLCPEVRGSVGGVELGVEYPDSSLPIELRVKRAQRVWFVAVDKAGRRVSGARVDVQDSGPTEDGGAGWFLGAKCSLVGAPGYCVVPAEPKGGDGSLGMPLEFALEPVNKVNIIVSGKSKRPAWLHSIVLRSPVPLMAGGRRWSEFDGSFGGSRCSSWSQRKTSTTGEAQESYELRITPDDSGSGAVWSVEPGIECELIACDQTGAELARSSLITPPLGAESVVKVVAEKETLRVRGRVLRDDGAAVAHAALVLAAGDRKASALSMGDGRYEFPSVYVSGTTDVTVCAPGYVKTSKRIMGVAGDEVGLDFLLVKGRVVRASVVEEGGGALDLYAQPLGYPEQQGQKLGIGVWQFSDLPDSVEFYTTVQGRRFSARSEATAGEVTVKVPRLARVWVPLTVLPAGRGWNQDNCCVELRSLQHPELEVVRLRLRDKPEPIEFALPGEYAAEVVMRRVGSMANEEFASVGVVSTVKLVAGEVTSVRFE